ARPGGAEGVEALEVAGHRVVALHPAQHLVAPALDRQVEVRRDARLVSEGVDQRVGPGMRMAGGEAPALDAPGLAGPEQQLGEGDATAVGVDVLADEGDLADTHGGEGGDLLQDLDEGAADLAASGVWHDAEAADVVAALHHGDELA